MNEADDFIHVLKDWWNVLKSENDTIHQDRNVILQRFEYAACSETIKSATLHRSRGDWIDLLPLSACFRNCFTFFYYLRAGWGTSRKRRPFMPRKASDNGYAGFWCVLLLWRSFALNRINKFFSLTIESNVTGADQDNRKDLPYCPRISCWYTTWDTTWEINEDYDFCRTTRSTKIMISGTLHQNLRHRIWNSAMLTTTDFTTCLLSIVLFVKMKLKQPLRVLRAWSSTGKVGLLCQGNNRARWPWNCSSWKFTGRNTWSCRLISPACPSCQSPGRHLRTWRRSFSLTWGFYWALISHGVILENTPNLLLRRFRKVGLVMTIACQAKTTHRLRLKVQRLRVQRLRKQRRWIRIISWPGRTKIGIRFPLTTSNFLQARLRSRARRTMLLL